MKTLINEDQCIVLIHRSAIDDPDNLYNYLVNNVPWLTGQKQVIYGRECDIPRALFFAGDDGVVTYRYSRLSFPVVPWVQPGILDLSGVREIRDIVQDLGTQEGYNLAFDSCLMNYYRSGQEYIAYHGDKEVRCAHNAVVTVSLGTTRRFILKRVKDAPADAQYQKGDKLEVRLNSGDVVMMLGDTQSKFHHTIPKETKVTGGRISLTYRLIN